MDSGETYTTRRWVLTRQSDDSMHSFEIGKGCIDTVNVDGKTYLKKAGRNFWNEYIRIGYVLDEKLSNKCKHWNMKEFNDMCRVKES